MAYCFRNHYEYRKDNGRHDEDLDHIPEYKKELDDFVDEAKTILFVGWRFDDPIAYHSFDYLTKFAKVTLVEAFPKNCEEFHTHNIGKYPVEVICADVLEFIQTTDRTFDLCIWQDGPEHVKYEEFVEFLKHAFTKIKSITISTPNGVFPQEEIGGNKYEWHKTTYFDYNFENLGFKTAKWLASVKDTTDPEQKQSALMGFRRLVYPNSPDKKNLFVYPNSRTQSQDKINEFWDTTPMSIEGRNKHFNIVSNPEEADLFFMGMISCGTVHEFQETDFQYLDKYPDKHLFELEGDWVNNHAPEWLAKLKKSGNSSKPEHLIGPLCVRPAVSNLLAYLAKDNPEYVLEFPEAITFGFKGYPDPFGVRTTMVNIMKKMRLPGHYELTSQFGSRQDLQSQQVQDYYGLLYSNLISMCPRGAGVDSIRFYETCFFGRVPVCISDAKWLGEDYYDMSFAFRLSPSFSEEEIAKQLLRIKELPYNELVDRGTKARQYFENVVVKYFEDPTLYFIEFLKRHNLYS